jgi:hypothetical protein
MKTKRKYVSYGKRINMDMGFLGFPPTEPQASHEVVIANLRHRLDYLKKVVEVFPILKKGAYYLRTGQTDEDQHILRINYFLFDSMNITTIAGSAYHNVTHPFLDSPYFVNYMDWLTQFKLEPIDKKDFILFVGWPCLGKEFEKAMKKALK